MEHRPGVLEWQEHDPSADRSDQLDVDRVNCMNTAPSVSQPSCLRFPGPNLGVATPCIHHEVGFLFDAQYDYIVPPRAAAGVQRHSKRIIAASSRQFDPGRSLPASL
ncbi:hypothetical protein PtrM4_011340 [Pyrenophora tritici-repentis]|uniref:Uncharacterized protein n=1 Tax=Pyrenophora tritici-repentis TaxID=45151 RepID=A0A834VW68_9PLEO|nr:hypothetical protein PtrM4_011340 [Pyrenophora tritici-repentis]